MSSVTFSFKTSLRIEIKLNYFIIYFRGTLQKCNLILNSEEYKQCILKNYSIAKYSSNCVCDIHVSK